MISTTTAVVLGSILAAVFCFKALLSFRRQFVRFLLPKVYGPKRPSKLLFALLKLLLPRSAATFDFQPLLPKLPVPALKSTAESFLASVRPLLSDDEFAKTEAAMADFLAGEAPALQKVLLERAAASQNWLEEWWLEFAYLRGRAPLPTNVNIAPVGSLEHAPPAPQIPRAAMVIHLCVKFWQRVGTAALKPLRAGGIVPVDMSGYDVMFGTLRLPVHEADQLVHGDREALQQNGFVVIHYGSRMFKLTVIKAGKPVPLAVLEASLRWITSTVSSPFSEDHPDVSLLTTMERNKWADDHLHLASLSDNNRASLAAIQDSLFSLVLHEGHAGDDTNAYRLTLAGDGRRVWFDKCISFLVFADGALGANIEHSWSDAGPSAHLFEYILASEEYDASRPTPETCPTPPEALVWDIDDRLHASIAQARKDVQPLTQLGYAMLRFKDFGKNELKSWKMSPDALLQQALQVAGYQHFGRTVLTYESVSTRGFFHGRTECTRSASSPSAAFVQAFLDPAAEPATVVGLLRAATSHHSKMTQVGSKGLGCDRHLMGLRLAAVTSGRAMPVLFTLPALNLEFELSTSHPPLVQEFSGALAYKYPPHKQAGGGFGPVTNPGVGVSYWIVDNEVRVWVTCRSTAHQQDADAFNLNVARALRRMQTLVADVAGAAAATKKKKGQ